MDTGCGFCTVEGPQAGSANWQRAVSQIGNLLGVTRHPHMLARAMNCNGITGDVANRRYRFAAASGRPATMLQVDSHGGRKSKPMDHGNPV